MGPITLYDVVGLDTAVLRRPRDARGVSRSRRRRRRSCRRWSRPAAWGKRLARASSTTQDKKGTRRRPIPAVDESIKPLRRGKPQKFSHEQITDRLFLPMLLEATRMLEDKIVRDVARRRPGADLRHRLSAVQRRPVLLGRHAGRGQDRRNAQAATSRSAKRFEADADAAGNGQDRRQVLRLKRATEFTAVATIDDSTRMHSTYGFNREEI